MKLYKVVVTDKKTKSILESVEVRSYTKKRLQTDYYAKWRFHQNLVVISIERMTRKPGTQLNIIGEIENGNN